MREDSIVARAAGGHKDPGVFERIQEWKQWVQRCHLSSIDEVFECVTFADGMICVKVEGAQRLLKMSMDNGSMLDNRIDEPSRVEPMAQAEPFESYSPTTLKPPLHRLKKSRRIGLGRPACSQNVRSGTALQGRPSRDYRGSVCSIKEAS